MVIRATAVTVVGVVLHALAQLLAALTQAWEQTENGTTLKLQAAKRATNGDRATTTPALGTQSQMHAWQGNVL